MKSSMDRFDSSLFQTDKHPDDEMDMSTINHFAVVDMEAPLLDAFLERVSVCVSHNDSSLNPSRSIHFDSVFIDSMH